MKKALISSLAVGMMGVTLAFSAAFLLPSSVSAITLSRELEFGMSGSDVTDLQSFLAASPSIYPEGLITGYFGSLTRAAVMRYQGEHGIAQVGRVGPITLASINGSSGSTIGLDRSAPIISSVGVSTTNNSATISWTTDKATAGVVYYDTAALRMTEANGSTGIAISGTQALANKDLTTTHSVTITGLLGATTYNYAIYSRDGLGNEAVKTSSMFRTN